MSVRQPNSNSEASKFPHSFSAVIVNLNTKNNYNIYYWNENLLHEDGKRPNSHIVCVSSTLCLRLVANLTSDTAVTNHPHTGFRALISNLLCCDAYISYCSFCPSRANKMKILKKIFQSAQLIAFYTHESLLDLFHLQLYRISSTKKFAKRSN